LAEKAGAVWRTEGEPLTWVWKAVLFGVEVEAARGQDESKAAAEMPRVTDADDRIARKPTLRVKEK
jgi:hypothetical protein